MCFGMSDACGQLQQRAAFVGVWLQFWPEGQSQDEDAWTWRTGERDGVCVCMCVGVFLLVMCLGATEARILHEFFF